MCCPDITVIVDWVSNAKLLTYSLSTSCLVDSAVATADMSVSLCAVFYYSEIKFNQSFSLTLSLYPALCLCLSLSLSLCLSLPPPTPHPPPPALNKYCVAVLVLGFRNVKEFLRFSDVWLAAIQLPREKKDFPREKKSKSVLTVS